MMIMKKKNAGKAGVRKKVSQIVAISYAILYSM